MLFLCIWAQSYLSVASLFSSTIGSICIGGTKTDCTCIIRESICGVIAVAALLSG
jgi:hypothetical protein